MQGLVPHPGSLPGRYRIGYSVMRVSAVPRLSWLVISSGSLENRFFDAQKNVWPVLDKTFGRSYDNSYREARASLFLSVTHSNPRTLSAEGGLNSLLHPQLPRVHDVFRINGLFD